MKDPIRVTTATKIWRSIRRWFARSEWAVWLLGLKRNPGLPTEPGLIIIQIDGLSQQQLKRAMADGRMPFVQSLLEKENYINHSLYSGLPSSTPAVQAELFYGHRTAVPAFGFRDHRTGRLVRMFASATAAEVEESLQEKNQGLLHEGSSYSNIYGGGAEEIHFCATSFGWNEFLNTLNPFQILLVMLLNFFMFFRIIGLMAIEVIRALVDFVKGILSGHRFWQELIMIPARVIVVVLLRELVTIGACFDAARGLPIIHLNLLGYDEQAHRRGPSSRFAHWTLKSIDRRIKQIWKAAHQGAGREYDLWIFSDHGQEDTQPFELTNGVLVQQVVAEVVEKLLSESEGKDLVSSPDSNSSEQDLPALNRLPTRADWIGLSWLVTMLFGEQDHDIQSRSPWVQTVTSGPLGFVYLLNPIGEQRREEISLKLLKRGVPMCAFLDHKQRPTIVSPAGKFYLPKDADLVFANHPFLGEIETDLVRLIKHKDAGDIVLIGWNGTQPTSSFVLQNGAHAGPGIDETSAFALLPIDTKLPQKERDFLRPNDLRLAVLRFLDRDVNQDFPRRQISQLDHFRSPIRVLSYNVHACVGMDGQLSPRRIARVIEQSGAEIICLQELDVLRHRSGFQDQAQAIAEHLEMSHQFHPAWHLEEEQFGNAILTRLPMRVVQKQGLHHHKTDRSRRSAIWIEVHIADTALQIINTHLSIYPQEQKIQAQQLIDEWIKPASQSGPVILCGDFNASPRSKTYKLLSQALSDIESYDGNPTRRTLFSPFPISRVDHGFISSDLHCHRISVLNTRLAKIASDHLPLLFEIQKSNKV